ncbi:MAG: lasso peptide biosynthesis B2 protein [Novosphingobium sp.]
MPELRRPALLPLLWREKWLLGLAFCYLWQARVLLSLKGFGDPREGCAATAREAQAPTALARRIAWSVDQAARFVLRPTCLVRAMAGQRMLALKGHGSEIHVGVRKTANKPFDAHAWLISGDEIVLGGTQTELAEFSPLIGAR